jgi:hypothetical protein
MVMSSGIQDFVGAELGHHTTKKPGLSDRAF